MISKSISRSSNALGAGLAVLATALLIGAFGGTASAGADSLSWYQCGAWGGLGVYEDANCSKKGASNSYSWLRPSSTPFTTSNTLSGIQQPYIIKYTQAGIAFEVECDEAQGSGTLVNTETQANIEKYNLTLSDCWVTKPGGAIGCLVSSEAGSADHKIIFNSLKASSPKSPEALNPNVKFAPSEGVPLATFLYEGCSHGGTSKLVGSFLAKMHNDASLLGTTAEEMLASGTLKLNSVVGPKVGITSVKAISSESGKPVKLDTVP